MSALVMLLSAGVIILIVRYGLLRGIELVAGALGWSAKARGQATGFATSVPELVTLIAAGLAGVWDAGLWNIASSNIINAALMAVAVVWNRQLHELFDRRFWDEVGFAAAAVAVPLVLMQVGVDTHWVLVPLLLLFFWIYRVVDARLNRTDPASPSEEEPEPSGNLPLGLITTLTAVIAIAIAGMFLGDATEAVVNQLGVHPAIAGWILGLTTSLPELITFFAVYDASRRAGTLHLLADTQEALDNLTASNMANAGVIYPIGLAAFLLAGLLA